MDEELQICSDPNKLYKSAMFIHGHFFQTINDKTTLIQQPMGSWSSLETPDNYPSSWKRQVLCKTLKSNLL